MSLNVGIFIYTRRCSRKSHVNKSCPDELGIDGKVTDVKTPEEISQLDGLIIPGGESTTIGQLSLGKWFS